MDTLIPYFYRVILISGFFTGFYYLCLKDRTFHQWNRFYLLLSAVTSLLIPLLSFSVSTGAAATTTPVALLQTVTSQVTIFENLNEVNTVSNSKNWYLIAYAAGCLLMLSVFIKSLYRIYQIRNTNSKKQIAGLQVFFTTAAGAPFSFGKSIFWNRKISLDSAEGQLIFQHEKRHITYRHSYDKLMYQFILIIFWLNPFFWIIRRELEMVHEFQADDLPESNSKNLAACILSTAYSGQHGHLINQFFHSPINRRIKMMNKNKFLKTGRLTRWLSLPVAAIIFAAFTIKPVSPTLTPVVADKVLTVMIDAGHGGDDRGAMFDGVNEKDLSLAIAREVAEMNQNKQIKIVLTRDADKTVSLQDRIALANSNKADLFISIHLEASMEKNPKKNQGINILIPKDENTYLQQSKELGSSMMEAFKSNYSLPVADQLVQLQRGVYLLRENITPVILIHAASMSAQNDLSFITKKENQKLVAENILKGIELYAGQFHSK